MNSFEKYGRFFVIPIFKVQYCICKT